MADDLLKAKEMLLSNGYTCVLVKDDEIYHSFDRGVKPLLKLLDDKVKLDGFSAGDKVVGKATAFLYVIANVASVYAPVMSVGAIDVFKKYNVKYFCDKQVDFIVNRSGDGKCPMETAVLNVDNPQDALTAIKEKLKTL